MMIAQYHAAAAKWSPFNNGVQYSKDTHFALKLYHVL